MSAQVGITGLGAFHLPLLQSLNETKVVAVCDVDESVLGRADVSNKYTDHKSMIQNEQLDFVVIATPPSVRVNPVKLAAQNDVPVILEKPTGLSVDTVDKLIRMREKYNVPITATQNVLYFPVMQDAVRRVANGEIGDVTAVNVIWAEQKRLSGADQGQEAWVSELHGGAISEALPHPCYCGLTFTDQLGDDISILWRNYSKAQWPDGVSIQATDMADRLISIRFLTNTKQKQRVLIHGTEGELTVDLLGKSISVEMTDDRSGKTIKDSFPGEIPDELSDAWIRGHYQFFRKFNSSLKSDDTQVPVSLEQDRDVVRLLDQAESTS